MVQSVKNEFGDMTDHKTGYGKIDLGTSNKIRENEDCEDCVLELVTAEGASSRFLLNEIVGRYRNCIYLIMFFGVMPPTCFRVLFE